MEKMKRLRNEYRSLPKKYYHLCTDGWKEGLLFHTEAQYVSAMTSLALMTLKFDITIYGFALMPNHVHILLSGTGASCLQAFFLLTHRCTRRLRLDGHPQLPASYWFKLIPVENQESFRTHLLYIARNPYEKGRRNPGGYLWGSDYLIYSDWADILRGIPTKNMKQKDVAKLIDCHDCLPEYWEIHPRLGILARNFVKTESVYKLFPTSKSYMTKLVKDYETYVHVSDLLEEEVSFSDTEMKDIIYTQTSRLFPGKKFYQLTSEEKIRLVVTLVEQYRFTPQQLATFLHISEHTINQALHSKTYGTTVTKSLAVAQPGGPA